MYVPDNLPLSPSLPLFFPATEKSGQGGPPIKPVMDSFLDSSIILFNDVKFFLLEGLICSQRDAHTEA